MHQHPRTPPAMATAIRSQQTNSTRPTNPREIHVRSRQNSESGPSGEQGLDMEEGGNTGNSLRDTSPEGKLDLIVQNYFYKAALMILDARTALPQAYTTRENKPRVNRWFNTELPETDELLDSTRQWKNATAFKSRPPPMLIETYVDLRDLAANQKLVISDAQGKRQDVETAILEHLGSSVANDAHLRNYRILLERWVCELGWPHPNLDDNHTLNEILPKVYKGSIVLYRSLFAHLKFMPAWKLYKRASKPQSGQLVPKLRWRIYDATQRPVNQDLDELEIPLISSQEKVTETIRWDPVNSPAGQFSIKVSYRTNCDFKIDTLESLFNSRFMASDEQWFQPSLPRSSILEDQKQDERVFTSELGSLPAKMKEAPARQGLNEIVEHGAAYGSMSTFHNISGKIGISPLSALRAARELHSRSPTDSSPQHSNERQPAMGSVASRPSVDAGASPMARRTSVSIQPFKTPAFSSSTSADQVMPASPRVGNFGRSSPLAALNEARHPSLTSVQSVSPYASPKLAEAMPLNTATGSPQPTSTRYSSSFSHRRNRASIGSYSNKTEDENSVGDRSNTMTGPGAQAGTSSEAAGSSPAQTDDENISDFLKMLDSKKELKSFRTTPSPSAVTPKPRGATAALNKFQQLRDSHAALSESLSSSQMMQRSSISSSSRQLANVPAMIAGTSTSIASSPGERISPRTPHTPAIPSRLSSNSIIEYNQMERGQRTRHRFSGAEEMTARVDDGSESDRAVTSRREETNGMAGAIPIPTSPRIYQSNFRRSSSAAAHEHHRNRGSRHDGYDLADDIGEMIPFALRSASLGDGDEREPLSLSSLFRLQEAAGAIPTGVPPPLPELDTQELVRMAGIQQSAPVISTDRGPNGPAERTDQNTGSHRASRLSARGSFGPTGRHSFSRPAGLTNFEDDEPLLFAMSEQLENMSSNSGVHGSRGSNSRGNNGRERGDLAQQW